MKKHVRILLFIFIAAFCASFMGFTGVAEAKNAQGFPWEAALQKLADSLTGPVAFALGLLMIVCGFCAVAFVGSELGGWVRWVAMAAILAGMLGMAENVLGLFQLSSAVIF